MAAEHLAVSVEECFPAVHLGHDAVVVRAVVDVGAADRVAPLDVLPGMEDHLVPDVCPPPDRSSPGPGSREPSARGSGARTAWQPGPWPERSASSAGLA